MRAPVDRQKQSCNEGRRMQQSVPTLSKPLGAGGAARSGQTDRPRCASSRDRFSREDAMLLPCFALLVTGETRSAGHASSHRWNVSRIPTTFRHLHAVN
jgi:hypothetical protein